MQWEYRVVRFAVSLSGPEDEIVEEVAATLNEQGAGGWELVSVSQVWPGSVLGFFKRQLPSG